ncbi:MAG TPA: hypothetical protein VN256_08490 [Pyrinomonadaceae bacterium]|nr:hypothetical protein [Pyrinomonadaceae bacterium]
MSTVSSRIRRASLAVLCLSLFAALAVRARAQTPQQPAQQANPAVAEWGDTFDGGKLDETKWERFTFEGGSGGKFEVKDGQLRMRGIPESRAGVRSRQEFTGDRFIVNATVSKVGAMMPKPDEAGGGKPGNAILTVLFDGSGRNRLEWLLTSEGQFEAWVMTDGRGERIDNRKMGTKAQNPTISIMRKGDEYFFALNGEIGLQRQLRDLPRAFRVMLYGFGTSENNWDSVSVVTAKQ